MSWVYSAVFVEGVGGQPGIKRAVTARPVVFGGFLSQSNLGRTSSTFRAFRLLPTPLRGVPLGLIDHLFPKRHQPPPGALISPGLESTLTDATVPNAGAR